MSRKYDLLDPKNDAVFKMMWSLPGSKPALIALLNAALRPKVPITDLEVINPNVPIEIIGDKGTILDIHAKLADGTRIDIEMQMRSHKYLGRRAAYYGARMTVDSLKKGGDYDQVANSNVLFFLAEDQFHHRPDDFHVCYALRQIDSGAEAMPQLRDQMQLHFFEIPKAVKKIRAGCFDASNLTLGHWLGFFNSPSDPLIKEACMTNPALKAAMESLEAISADKDAREIARLREKAQHHWASEIRGARQEGIAEGEAKGEAKGKADTTLANLRAMLISPATRNLANEVIAGVLGVEVNLVVTERHNLDVKNSG